MKHNNTDSEEISIDTADSYARISRLWREEYAAAPRDGVTPTPPADASDVSDGGVVDADSHDLDAHPEERPVSSRRRSYSRLAVAAMAAAVVLFIVLPVAKALTLSNQLAEARREAQQNREAELIVKEFGPIAPTGSLQGLAFVPASFPAVVEPGEVEVTVRNDFFACRVLLKSDADNQVRDVTVPRGDSKIKIPAGKIRVSCEPMHGGAWFQPFGVVDKRGYLGSSLGPVLLTVNAGDPLHIRMDQPFPPWNGTMLRIKGEWVIVTLERPWADFQMKEFLAGKFGGKEEFPNTALFWARDKTNGMSEELAKFFVANRAKNRDGKFRGLRHTSLIVPTTATGVSEVFEKITAEELTEHLTEAFDYLRKQRPPVGRTIEQEIARGAELLKTIPKKK